MALTCPRCGKTARGPARFCPYDGTKLEGAAGDPLVGRVIAGRYRVVRSIGAGGMARVYLAHASALGMEVAFKVLHPEFALDHMFVGRFAREAEAIGRIDHENVVSVIDFGRATQDDLEPFYYLAMEHVAGRPLDSELERAGAMLPARAAHVLAQITAGIARAHDLDIVHRDLKPQNVMLRQRGADPDFVTILDFGLSRTIVPDANMPALTKASDVLGTPHYMAPERWVGGDVDKRSDIYALGVIGYELLTGARPFEGSNMMELIFRHSTDTPQAPSALVPAVPEALDRAVLTCLEKKPENRFQSVDDLLLVLGEAWRTLTRQSTRTTYAATAAAPPRRSTDDLPDSTVWHSNELDALSDGPAVIKEIAHLHALRRRYLGELAEAVWPAIQPDRVLTVLGHIGELEARMDEEAEEIALVESTLAELERTIREQGAELRAEIIRVNVAMTCSGELALDADEEDEDTKLHHRDSVALATTQPMEGAVAQIRRAERSLASLQRHQIKEQVELRGRLGARVAEVRRLETQLLPHYEALARILDDAVPRGSSLQPLLTRFQKVDGALAAYEGLLAALEERSA